MGHSMLDVDGSGRQPHIDLGAAYAAGGGTFVAAAVLPAAPKGGAVPTFLGLSGEAFYRGGWYATLVGPVVGLAYAPAA
jgi:hypothetical protein